MKIFKIKFKENGYDEYDSFIIKAKDSADAIKVLENKYPKDKRYTGCPWYSEFDVNEISLDGEGEILLGSFNAG